MTREDLREYCKNQIEIFEQFEVTTYKAPFKREQYERCKLILELLDSEQQIIKCNDCRYYRALGERSYCTKRLNVDSVTDRYRAPDFYCADAELREVINE